MGLLNRIFGGRQGEPEAADLSGPLRLAPGDSVSYYREKFVVRGTVLLEEGGGCRHQYRLEDESGAPFVLSAGGDGELRLTLEQPVDRADVQYDGGEELLYRGVAFALASRGTATASGCGDTPEATSMGYQEFADVEGERLVVFERWGAVTEARFGEYVDEGELSFRRRGSERYVPKAPTRIDLRAVHQARHRDRPRPKALSEEEKKLALAEARAKLAAMAARSAEDSSATEEPEGQSTP